MAQFSLFKMELKTFRTDLISLFQDPPWCEPAEGMKVHLIHFLKMNIVNLHLIPLFNGCSQLTLCYYEVCPIMRTQLHNLATSCSYSYGQTGKKNSILLHQTPSTLYLARSNVIYSTLSKWWLIWRNSFKREVCHLLGHWLSIYVFNRRHTWLEFSV